MTSTSSPRVAIVAAVRTPIGKYGGTLKATPAVELGSLAARDALDRARLPPGDIPEVLFGHCIQAGTGQNPARQVLRGAGIPDASGATTVNMVCGSGMKAIHFGADAIRAGTFGLLIAGGMESMSSAPFLATGRIRWGVKYGSQALEDAMIHDSLQDAYGEHEQMGFTGERIAESLHLTREEVDAFAARSHQRAARAIREGLFQHELVSVPAGLTPGAKGLDADEGPRGNTTVEALARLKPSFKRDGLLTAGNSSQLSDGAAALVLASEREVERRGLVPLAWIHSYAVGGVHPSRVMEAPIPTVRKHLEDVGLGPTDFDRVEHNEAFASASIAVQRAFNFTDEQFNVHGGAVALGHPIGCSGARIVVTLVHELARTRGHRGLATLCMGGGNGLSLIVERHGA
ncbi:MAG TPA: acetyl-CoA C-acyltransferase [Thermoplasmata archaeon]|nr:acetyl-CoA C-acyltransferase [Thermoplasmata archaeon]